MICLIFVVVCAAFTLYCATAILPFSSTTKVERITPGDRLAVHLLFAVGAPGRQHLAVGIGQQRERQPLGVTELGQLLRLVGGDADDVESGIVELVRLSRKSQACLVQPGVEAAG